MQNIVILGSTGSIGTSTLDVIRLNPELYKVFALTANTNVNKLFTQCLEFTPRYAVILDSDKALWLQEELKNASCSTTVLSEVTELINLVKEPSVDVVMSALVGSSGLEPTYSAICANKKVLLANKESLVAAGQLILNTLRHPDNIKRFNFFGFIF
jgi:1-deoxy-D-xylulose-5-phosphate reductoisomerase